MSTPPPPGQPSPHDAGSAGMPSYQPTGEQYGSGRRGAAPPEHARLLTLTVISAGLYLLNLVVSLVVTSTVDLEAAYQDLGFSTAQAQMAAEQAGSTVLGTVLTAVVALSLYALVYTGLKKGRNWARILGIILVILSILGSILGIFGSMIFGSWAIVLIGLTVAVLIVDILWLITAFKKPVAVWFTQQR